jgi:hypothetical protein
MDQFRVIPGHRSEIRVSTSVQGNEGDKIDLRVWPDENGLLGRYVSILHCTYLFQFHHMVQLHKENFYRIWEYISGYMYVLLWWNRH